MIWSEEWQLWQHGQLETEMSPSAAAKSWRNCGTMNRSLWMGCVVYSPSIDGGPLC